MASHPASYTAWAFTELNGKLQKITVPWKHPNAGEVVVKVLACGVCASDEILPSGAMGLPLPRIPGHEIVGDVIEVGPGETLWKVGDRVGGGWHGGHCSTCKQCRQGDYVTCQKQDINGILRDGGYAEYATLRTEAVASVPRELDPAEAAPLLCAGITVFNSLRNMPINPPDYVAVQGIGGLGHLAVQFASKMGYRVVALSSGSSKEQFSKQLGAEAYFDGSKVNQAEELQKLGGMKVIVTTSLDAKAIGSLIGALDVNGTLLILSVLAEPIPVVPAALLSKRLTIRSWPSGNAKDSEDTLKFALAHDVKALVQRFPLEKAQEAFDSRATARFRAVIVP